MSDSINKFRVWDNQFEEYSNWTNRDPFFDISTGKIFFWERVRKDDGSYDGDIVLEDLNERFVLERNTGMRSSNGNKDIYEGDIVKVKYTVGDHAWDDMDEDERKSQSEMILKYYAVVVKQKMLEPCNLELVCGNIYFPLFYVDNGELLGNVHENEELLEYEKN